MPSFFQKQSLQPLQISEYRYFLAARFFLIMSLRMLGTVAAYKLFMMTQDSFSIGLAGLSEFVPVFLLALYAGHVIDKSDKRTLILRSILLYSVCVIAMIVITSPGFQNRVHTTSPALYFYIVIFFYRSHQSICWSIF